MDNSKLNATIASYATSFNYEGAIMLTAQWGAGKSYYLQAELIPFLKSQGIKTLVVSLHGLKNDFEISKSIYVEYLLAKDKTGLIKDVYVDNKTIKEAATHISFAGKTIVRGIASFFNVNLSCSEEELKKLYDSIDLSDTLIVFEDVERSNMSSKEIMAYVNKLVEYDHNKVLLITYEDELNKLAKDDDEYKNIKEKTVGDTLHFKGDQIDAIKNMMNYLSQETIGPFLKNEMAQYDLANEIVSEIKDPVINLRSIKYGLSKFNEMISLINNEIDSAFEKTILISMLVFAHKYRKDNTIKWDTDEEVLPELTGYNYPLQRFVYDFIVNNDFKSEVFLTKQKEYEVYQKKIEKQNSLNAKLSTLYSCFISDEKDVKEVIIFVKDALKDINIIPFEFYFKIANYLIYLKYVIRYDETINECLSLMKKNLNQLPENQFDKISFYGGIALDDTRAAYEFKQFREDITAIVKKNKMNPLSFSYKMSDLDSFCKMAINSRDTYLIEKSFASRLDINKLLKMIKKCSSMQINQIREVFLHIYSSVNIKEFLFDDKQSLEQLLKGIIDIQNYNKFDAIQKKQISYFINNLEHIIEKLEEDIN